MDKLKIIKETTRALEKVSLPERKKLSEWYFPTKMKVLGLKSDDIKDSARDLKKRLALYGDPEKISLLTSMASSGIFELQLVAFSVLNKNFSLIEKLTASDVILLGTYMDNWVSTDSFSVQVSGPSWRLGVINDKTVMEWSFSKDRWWRRISLVSTVSLNLKSQKGEGDIKRTLLICNNLVADRDDMVVKAMSWALRELSKRYPDAVSSFLSEKKDMLAARVSREVTRKLITGRKNG